MSIVIESIAASAKARYIAVGRVYGSETTLAQADSTLKALAQWGSKLTAHGFSAKDAQRLADARDALVAAGVERKGASVASTEERQGNAVALRGGKDARGSAHSVLIGARAELLEEDSDSARAGVQSIDVTLARSARSGANFTELGQQLTLLRDLLVLPAVQAAALDRGGPAAVDALSAAIAKLDAAPRAIKRGTPAETERLDVLDGIVVTLCRSARRAARVASKHLGSPALASAFALDFIDPPRRAATPAAPVPEPTAS
jgi:hypothetical protein